MDIIQLSGEHLLTLINDVLDLSKIEARKMELHLAGFNFTEFLKNIADISRVSAQQKSLSFAYEPLSPIPIGVRGDEQRLRQVLLNLLNNAVKFTEKGGVVFKVGYFPPLEEGQREGRKIRFQIEDTGLGIAPEKVDEIFQPFQQVSERTHLVEGTGLGLAISQKLVQIMGGELKVHSIPSMGSTFWFELDLPEVSDWVDTPKADERAIIGFDGQKRKIMVVDDKWENRSVITSLLLPLGFVVVEAADGAEALRKAANFKPDLILMDLVMPLLDGFEATRCLRQTPALKDIIVVALSASAFDHTRQECLAAGCDDFVPKPVRADYLLDRLQLHLELTWNYEQGSGGAGEHGSRGDTISPSPPPPISPASLVAPSPQEAAALLELAMQGDIKGILQQVDQIEQAGEQFAPFANQVRRLAKGFQMKQIREFVKQFVREEVDEP
ncbi:MAG: response regulator [Myxococcales bacterium]|nr:response regulator [Myxococcales bacterium]